MFSFKQLEALYWISTLGSFAGAAKRLNTTQSAISKRIKELETACKTELFDRDLRQARLTDKGEEMLSIAKKLLDQRDAAVEQFRKAEHIERHLRIGVTELTAMTWLPRWIRLIRANYPKVIIEPDVDFTSSLRAKLLANEVDLVITPNAFHDPRLSVMELASVRTVWMAKPGMFPRAKSVRIHELASYTILTQGLKSGTGILYDRWLKANAAMPENEIISSSLLTLIGLTVAGVGVSYLPYMCLRSLVERGSLEIVETTPELPDIPYVAQYHTEGKGSFIASILMLAQECCDFSDMFQTGDNGTRHGDKGSKRSGGVFF